MRTVDDSEVGMNVVDLGLVYGVEVRGDDVSVRLTMTSPACPLGDVIIDNANAAILVFVLSTLTAVVRGKRAVRERPAQA